MKKILSMALALALALVLVSCGKSAPSDPEGTKGTESFVKPEQYASVLLITINPQFRLYLDENEKVLAVEAVNKDAESMKDGIAFKNESVETVIENIVTAANTKGFVKADATISFEIVESKEPDDAKADILAKAEKKAKDIAGELKIEIEVNIGEIKTNQDPSSSETELSSNPTSSEPTNVPGTSGTKPTGNSKATNPTSATSTSVTKSGNHPTSSEPTHTHSFSAATCTDPKKCSCGAIEGTPLGHDYKDGVCTRCKAKDPNYKLTSVLQKQGQWTLQYLNEKELYSVSIIVCKPGENSADVGIGVPLSTMPPDMQSDPNIKEYCEVFNGEYYYVGMGTSSTIKSVTEEDSTVTLTDPQDQKLVLTRTGENTLKCASAPKSFADISGIAVGAVFTFAAD